MPARYRRAYPHPRCRQHRLVRRPPLRQVLDAEKGKASLGTCGPVRIAAGSSRTSPSRGPASPRAMVGFDTDKVVAVLAVPGHPELGRRPDEADNRRARSMVIVSCRPAARGRHWTGVPRRSANSGTPRPSSSSLVRIVRPGGDAHIGVNGCDLTHTGIPARSGRLSRGASGRSPRGRRPLRAAWDGYRHTLARTLLKTEPDSPGGRASRDGPPATRSDTDVAARMSARRSCSSSGRSLGKAFARLDVGLANTSQLHRLKCEFHAPFGPLWSGPGQCCCGWAESASALRSMKDFIPVHLLMIAAQGSGPQLRPGS